MKVTDWLPWVVTYMATAYASYRAVDRLCWWYIERRTRPRVAPEAVPEPEEAPGCEHKGARARGVTQTHMWYGQPPAPTPVTDVLLYCEACGCTTSTRMLGHWRLDQLTILPPAAEVVNAQLRKEGFR